MGSRQVFSLTGIRAFPKKKSSYVQAIPIYLSSDTAISDYLTSFTAELDQITGSEIIILWSETVAKNDVKSIAEMLSKDASTRFPDLRLSDLPCLWIEDEFKRSEILKLPHGPNEIKQYFRILADASRVTKDAPELARLIYEQSSLDVRERSQFLTSLWKGVEMNKSKERMFALIFGVIFVAAILVIAIRISTPTPFQYAVFRITLSLAAAGFVSMTPGFLTVEVGRNIRAGGALAVFIVVFFFAPAALPPVSDQPQSSASASSAISGN